MASTQPTPRPARQPAQTASTSRAAPRPSARRCTRASSTSSGSTSSPFSSGQASGYSTASPSSISSPTRSSNPHWRRTSATAGRDEVTTGRGGRIGGYGRDQRRQLAVPTGAPPLVGRNRCRDASKLGRYLAASPWSSMAGSFNPLGSEVAGLWHQRIIDVALGVAEPSGGRGQGPVTPPGKD